MIIGINASGRAEGITSEAVMAVLKASGEEFSYFSLAGKKINGCTGCLACAVDTICKQKDDWNEIGAAMLSADAIVFGAPDYYGSINALGHACLERTFSFRHRERYRLAGKLGVVIDVSRNPEYPVGKYIEMMMISNKMSMVGSVHASGFSQCYTCGFGEGCANGNVVLRHGYLDEIKNEHLPPRFAGQEESALQARKTGSILGSIMRSRRNDDEEC